MKTHERITDKFLASMRDMKRRADQRYKRVLALGSVKQDQIRNALLELRTLEKAEDAMCFWNEHCPKPFDLHARLLQATRAFTGTIDTRNNLINALDAYEKTDDHNHGSGPIAAGKPCPGGDCTVSIARDLLAGRITRSL